jgi:hypothetical protein
MDVAHELVRYVFSVPDDWKQFRTSTILVSSDSPTLETGALTEAEIWKSEANFLVDEIRIEEHDARLVSRRFRGDTPGRGALP